MIFTSCVKGTPWLSAYRILFVMKLTVFLTMVFALQAFADTHAQNITLKAKNATLGTVMKEIQKQQGYLFFFRGAQIASTPITAEVNNAELTQAMAAILEGRGLEWSLKDGTIVIKRVADCKEVTIPIMEFIQERIVTGQVTDEHGAPLEGVTVRVKNTNIATTTNVEGRYEINISNKGNTLTYSTVGFEAAELIVADQSAINISLKALVSDLDEVVVVGYGTQKKETVVGAISTIRTADIKQSPAASLSVALAGRLPGLTMIQGSGEPGREDITLLIRGKGTFNSQAPLIIVDGIERGEFLDRLDPNEVDQISILKDASATAVYGVRGANGAIIVTTKRGKVMAPEVTFSTEYALQNYTRFPKRLDAYQYALLYNESLINEGKLPLYSTADLENWKNGTNKERYPDVDWFSEFTEPFSPQSRSNLNIRGGTENVQYFVNAGYLRQEGLWKTEQTEWDANTTLDRYNFRSNFDMKLNRTLKASLQAAGYLEKKNEPVGVMFDNDIASNKIFQAMVRTPSNAFNPLTPDGRIQFKPTVGSQQSTIYGMINSSGYVIESRNNITATFALEQDLDFLTKGLFIKGQFSFDSKAVNRQERVKNYARYTQVVSQDENGEDIIDYLLVSGVDTELSDAILGSDYWSNSVFLLSSNYERSFGDNYVTGLLLFQQEQKIIRADLPYNYRGMVGRGTYAFDNRYFTEVNFGFNGSEQFMKGRRYGFFPSFSLGWMLSEEQWMKERFKSISSLKLRGSYGLVGNDQMSNRRFLYLDDYGVGGGSWSNIGSGSIERFIGNREITWETSKKANFGIEAELFNSIDIVIDLFHEKRKDILTTRGTIPGMFGNAGALPPLNIGSVQNKGVELEAGYNKRFNNEFSFLTRLNVAYNRNKVIFADEVANDDDWATKYRFTGYTIGQPFGLISDGFFNTQEDIEHWADQTPLGGAPKLGYLKYVDQNGDNVIDERDVVPIGYPNEPLLNFGWAFQLKFKRIDFSGLFQGSAFRSQFISSAMDGEVLLNRHLGRWNEERYLSGEQITYPSLNLGTNANKRLNSFYLENASFLRLKSVEIGYSIPEGLTERLGLKSLRIYSTGLNLLTWDKLSTGDFDPELKQGDGAAHPLFRVFNVGINISF